MERAQPPSPNNVLDQVPPTAFDHICKKEVLVEEEGYVLINRALEPVPAINGFPVASTVVIVEQFTVVIFPFTDFNVNILAAENQMNG